MGTRVWLHCRHVETTFRCRAQRKYRIPPSGAHNSAAAARQSWTGAAGSPPGRALQPIATCTRGQQQRQIHTRWAPRSSRRSSGTPSSHQTALPSHRPKARTIPRQRAGKRAHPTDSEHGAAGPPRMVSELRHTMTAHLSAAPADTARLSGNSSAQPCPKATRGARQPAPRARHERPPPLRLSLPSGRDRHSVAGQGGRDGGPMMPSAPTTRGREHLGCVRGQPIIGGRGSVPHSRRTGTV